MTSGRFNDPGILDLSALKQPAPSGNGGGAQGAYVTEVNSPNDLQGLVSKSMQHVVVLEFFSARAQGAQQLSDDLIALSTEAQGKWLLARADCDAHPELPQALGVQAVPTVVAMIGGQLAPLFQGVQPKDAIRQVLDQVMQTAAANGIMGKAEPVAQTAPTADGEEPVSDPRFAAADEALARGDYAAARDEFDKLLTANPNDAEARAGKAQAGLLARSTTLDPGQALAYAAEHPDDHTAQLAAADIEVVTGNPAAAFDRIINLIRTSAGDDRDALRERLLELFETVGATDPAVLKARRALSAALF